MFDGRSACAAMMYWCATKLSSSCDWNMLVGEHAIRAPCRSTASILVGHVDVHRVRDARRPPEFSSLSKPSIRQSVPGIFRFRRNPRTSPTPSDRARTDRQSGIGFSAIRRAFRILAARHRVRARITLEEIIEAAVLLHDEDDVLDLARAGRRERSQRAAGLHGRDRRPSRAACERGSDERRPPPHCSSGMRSSTG